MWAAQGTWAGKISRMQRTPRKSLTTGAAVILSGLLAAGVGFTVIDARQTKAEAAQAAQDYTPAVTYTAPPQPTQVAFLGDSFTVGTGADDRSDRWTTLLARSQGWQELNYGVGGTNFASEGPSSSARPYEERLTDLVISQPDIVIVSSAGNSMDEDQSEGITSTFKALREGLPEAQIYATSPYNRAGEYPEHLTDFGDEIREAVEAVDGTYLDIGHPLGTNTDAMDEDGVHPNSSGYQLIAEAVEDELAE